MAVKIIITPRALQDLQFAIDYYNEQQKGLGVKFENIINDTFRRIQRLPKAASFIYDTIRYKVVDKFPFIIIYEETRNAIVILRVFNEQQHPEKLK